MLAARGFRRAWTIDFEYGQPDGERPAPRCMVARCAITSESASLWLDGLKPRCPFTLASDELFIAYSADAELGCFSSLDWPAPPFILDLFPEFLRYRNGWPREREHDGLVDALAHFGEPSLGSDEKNSYRRLAIRGGPYTPQEQAELIEYCATDIDATELLLERLAPAAGLDNPKIFEQALMRGRFAMPVAAMRANGVPINVALAKRFDRHWSRLKLTLADRLDAHYGVYVGGSFKTRLFEKYLMRIGLHNIWPRLDSGELSLTEKSFSNMSKLYPALTNLHELRQTLGKLRLLDLDIGRDGRNRLYFAPFRTKTGRNAPSNSRFIYGGAKWIRNMILAPRGYGLSYDDWIVQEVAVAAALSGDARLWEAIMTGDPYIAFGKAIGRLPDDATKETHEEERALYKALTLGIFYGMTTYGLALRANIEESEAKELMARHRRLYPRFWIWAERNADAALLGYPLTTRLGWTLQYAFDSYADASARTAMNFPVQANAAEIMRLAAIRGVEVGVRLCCPVHDAFLIEAPATEIEDVSATFRRIMADASETLLGAGYRIEADAKIARWPQPYFEKRGFALYEALVDELAKIEKEEGTAPPARPFAPSIFDGGSGVSAVENRRSYR
jgi:hypothetical protein